MKSSKILTYFLLFTSLYAISLISSTNIIINVVLALILTLYLYVIMNFLSTKKLISGFYFKENSNDIKMKLISYLMIFQVSFQSMFITIILCKEFDLEMLIIIGKTFLIYLFTILFLFSMSIKTKKAVK